MNAGCSAIGRTSTATTSRTLSQSGLRRVFAGGSAARYFGVPVSDPRHPDIWGIVQHGVVYTGGTGNIAENGGADPDDRICVRDLDELELPPARLVVVLGRLLGDR